MLLSIEEISIDFSDHFRSSFLDYVVEQPSFIPYFALSEEEIENLPGFVTTE